MSDSSRPMFGGSRFRFGESETVATTALSRSLRAVAPIFLLGWLLYLVALGPPQFNAEAFDAAVSLHGLYALLGIAYVAYLAANRRLPGPTNIDWAAAALVAVYAAAIALSVSPRISAEAALLIGVTLIAVYAFHDMRLMSVNVLLRVMVLFGLLLGLFAILGFYGRYTFWQELSTAVDGSAPLMPPALPRVGGIVDHPLRLAMLLNLCLPFAAALALRPVYKLDRPIACLALILALAGLFFTVSRGAWLGTLAAMPIFGVLFALRSRDLSGFSISLNDYQKRLLRFGLAGLAVLMVAGSLVALQTRPSWLFRNTLTYRLNSATVAVKMVEDHPIFGSGPYTYSLLYSQYDGKDPPNAVHPHNGMLSVLVDTGIVGLAVVIGGSLMLLAAIRKAYIAGDANRRVWLGACLASLTTLAVHSLTDSPNSWSHALIPLALVLALTLRLSTWPVAPSKRFSIGPRLMIVALLPVLFAGHLFFDATQAPYDASLKAMHAGDYASAATKAGEAARRDSHLAAYQFQAGVTNILLFQQDPEANAVALDIGIAYLQHGVELEPSTALGYANLALALQLRGDAPGAIEAAQQAFDASPSDATIAALTGAILEWAGQPHKADVAYGRAIKRNPSLAQSAFWSSSPQRAALRPMALLASGLNACELARPAVLYGAYADDLVAMEAACHGLVEKSSSNPILRANHALLLLSLGRPDEAVTQARRALALAPSSRDVRSAYGLVLSSQGDIAAVRHELMLSSYLGDKDGKLLLASTYGGGNEWAANLGLLSNEDAPPASVVRSLRGAISMTGTTATPELGNSYLLGINYYRLDYMRQAPSVLFIPGDWESLTSPRSLIIKSLLPAE